MDSNDVLNQSVMADTLLAMATDLSFNHYFGNGTVWNPFPFTYDGYKGSLAIRRWHGDKLPVPTNPPIVGVRRRPATTVTTFPNMLPDASSVVWHKVEKVGPLGAVTPVADELIKAGALPNPPTNVSVSQKPNGSVVVSWYHNERGEPVETTGFHVYSDNATGSFNLAAPIGSIGKVKGRQEYVWRSAVLSAGHYLFTVRSIGANRVESLLPANRLSGVGVMPVYTEVETSSTVPIQVSLAVPAAPSAPTG